MKLYAYRLQRGSGTSSLSGDIDDYVTENVYGVIQAENWKKAEAFLRGLYWDAVWIDYTVLRFEDGKMKNVTLHHETEANIDIYLQQLNRYQERM